MKLLYVTSLSGKRINGFMRSAILAARGLGIEVTMACNMDMADKEGYEEDCQKYGITVIHIDFERNPMCKKNFTAYKQLNEIILLGGYDVIHCNTPIGGVIGRICGHRNQVKKVIYQAHGFHFWKGAPFKNWMVYYPVERMLAHWTDILITINEEDYQQAKKFKLHKNGKLILHPGVGVNVSNYANIVINGKKRNEFGIGSNQIIFITVGELIKRKNQAVLIEAMKLLNRKDVVLLIVGDGELKSTFQSKIKEDGMDNQIKLLGFRSDVGELLKMSDCFVFPSLQEGLPGALMEAMAAGLPCIASNIRGNIDLLGKSGELFEPWDIDNLVRLMQKMTNGDIRNANAKKCFDRIQKYDINKSIESYQEIYANLIMENA